MKLTLSLFLLFVVSANANTASPLSKVIELLNGNLEKGKKAKADEVTMFQEYDLWCQDTQVDSENSIKNANDQIDEDKATIASLPSKIERLQGEIASHESDVAAYTEMKKQQQQFVNWKTQLI
jgi:peptidoglycan hydrolase CwlO-like protein